MSSSRYPVRLNKYLAGAGIASRRRAEEIIRQGRVAINEITVTQPYTQVEENDLVRLDGRVIRGREEKYYILLYKPPGYISTVEDTHNRPTVMQLVADIEARIYPVGRLDADTSGVLLLTNDGRLAYRLTHPSYQVTKVYQAWVKGYPTNKSINILQQGLFIDGKKTAPTRVEIIKKSDDPVQTLLQITMIEGRKRQVKKICSAIGHPVLKLHRTSFAEIGLDDLLIGEYRNLDEEEIKSLYGLVSPAK